MKDRKTFFSLVTLCFLILVIPVATILVQRKVVVPRAAELPSPIFFAPAEGEHNVGENFTVNIALNTENTPVDGLDVFVEAINLDIKGTSKATLPLNLFFIKDPQITGNRVSFSILADSNNRFKNNEATNLVSLTLSGKAYCMEATLTFNQDFTIVASQGKDIVGSPKDGKYNIKSPEGITNPVFTSPASVTVQVNQPMIYTATATNPNNGTLVFTYYNLPDWLVANGATITGTPLTTGTFTIGIIVEDGKGGSACHTLTIQVVDETGIIISNVVANPVTYDSATISWSTNRSSTSQVEYGETINYGRETNLNVALETYHRVTLEGLTPQTTYHFRVKSTAPGAPSEAVSGDYTFTTLARPQRILRVYLQMEKKKIDQNNYPVRLFERDSNWSVVFTPNANGSYPVSLADFPLTSGKHDFLLKGYQHLQVKRDLVLEGGKLEYSLNFGTLPAGDIAPRSNPDNYVNVMDYSVLVSEWNLVGPKYSVGDFNSDLYVNSIDYSIMVNNFHKEGDW